MRKQPEEEMFCWRLCTIIPVQVHIGLTRTTGRLPGREAVTEGHVTHGRMNDLCGVDFLCLDYHQWSVTHARFLHECLRREKTANGAV